MTTIATYSDSFTAHLAMGRLEDAGIRAFLADENTVGIAWHLTGAVHGMKLQVAESDANQARALLAHHSTTRNNSDADDFAVDADDPQESDQDPDESELVTDEPTESLTRRELTADRALKGALVGLLLMPLQFYVFALVINVMTSNQRLNPPHRRNALIAAIISIPCIAIMAEFLLKIL